MRVVVCVILVATNAFSAGCSKCNSAETYKIADGMIFDSLIVKNNIFCGVKNGIIAFDLNKRNKIYRVSLAKKDLLSGDVTSLISYDNDILFGIDNRYDAGGVYRLSLDDGSVTKIIEFKGMGIGIIRIINKRDVLLLIQSRGVIVAYDMKDAAIIDELNYDQDIFDAIVNNKEEVIIPLKDSILVKDMQSKASEKICEHDGASKFSIMEKKGDYFVADSDLSILICRSGKSEVLKMPIEQNILNFLNIGDKIIMGMTNGYLCLIPNTDSGDIECKRATSDKMHLLNIMAWKNYIVFSTDDGYVGYLPLAYIIKRNK